METLAAHVSLVLRGMDRIAQHAVMEHMDFNVYMLALAIERTLLIVMTSLGSVNVKTIGMELRVQFM